MLWGSAPGRGAPWLCNADVGFLGELGLLLVLPQHPDMETGT